MEILKPTNGLGRSLARRTCEISELKPLQAGCTAQEYAAFLGGKYICSSFDVKLIVAEAQQLPFILSGLSRKTRSV